MKLKLIFIIILMTGLEGLAQHRASIGIDFNDVLKTGNAGISISYRINGKWSISGHSDIKTSIKQASDDEYRTHLAEFGFRNDRVPSSVKRSLSLQYWLYETYEGCFISIGCRFDNTGKTDYAIDIGYNMHVWNCLFVFISYGIDESVSIGVSWTI